MAPKKQPAAKPAASARTPSLSPAETAAISIMRDLPADQRSDALRWIQKLTEERVISGRVLAILDDLDSDAKRDSVS